MRNILRIDMGKMQYQQDPIKTENTGYGGRALSSKLIAEEIPPDCDPLGPENKLIFSAGTLAGTSVPNSGRLSIGAKSPLTNGIKEANAGGEAARKLVRLGIQAVAIEGMAKEPHILRIDKDGVTFLDATEYLGAGNESLMTKLSQIYGKKVAVITNGIAGEMKLKAAGIAVSSPDFHPRMAARGGLGAVMGSKNLKAVIIDDQGSAGVEIANKPVFKTSSKALAKAISDHPFCQGLKALGTPLLVDVTNDGLGCLPTKNYSLGKFESANKITGTALAELVNKNPNGSTSHRCMTGCIIGCSNILTDETGEVITSGIEYETIGLVGSNCMIDDIEMIARINQKCNDLGLDTMDIGGAIALAMEEGILPWGDGRGALELISGIEKDSPNSIMIGNGCKHTGDMLKFKRIPHVKGQCLAAYDPRALKGTGVTYATSPMGADHTCGNIFPSEDKPEYDHLAAAGQAAASREAQVFCTVIDSLGLCLFASIPLGDPDLLIHLTNCVSDIIGKTIDIEELMSIGEDTLKFERDFNERAGFTSKDDRLPDFFISEKLETTGTVFDVSTEDLDRVHNI